MSGAQGGWDGALDLTRLRAAYLDGVVTPVEVVDEVLARLEARGDDAVWIERVPADALRARAKALTVGALGSVEELALFGVPFAVKDNIDVAGLPTTAACPAAARLATRSASVVARLEAAGALCIGKTNLDQFATGLSGTRSPYGIPTSVFDPADIAGGSSSGSAVAVAAGLVSLALGTDTAGSGRVPAGCNNIVGLKPTPGLVPTTGVLPAVRTLDCVSVFALSVPDALSALGVLAGADGEDPYARSELPALPPAGVVPAAPPRFRFGVPEPLQFHGDDEVAAVFETALRRAEALGGERVAVDFAPFAEVAAMLYDGPWLAERTAALAPLLDTDPEAIHPVVRTIVEGGRRFSALDTHRSGYRLAELRAQLLPVLAELDVLLVPTTPTTFTIAEMLDEPITRNAALGTYTNFVNLLGLAALAVPAGFTTRGRPAGITLVGAAGRDVELAAIGAALHAAAALPTGATGRPLPASDATAWRAAPPPNDVEVAVVGAHLRGQPLNSQLTELGARYAHTTTTAHAYRLYALADGQRPGLLRDAHAGRDIEVELWTLSQPALGRLLAQVAWPLTLGHIELVDNRWVLGYLTQPDGLVGATEITAHGGWRRHLAARA